VSEIGAAVKELDDYRRRWLDPDGAMADRLKKRTLAIPYNECPSWLVNAYARLDRAVSAACGRADPESAAVPEDAILSRLLALNFARAAAQAT
jgi:hypothetical protein